MKLIALVPIFAFLVGCQKNATITFVLPNGYSGPFLLVHDSNAQPSERIEDQSKLIYRIPESGILFINDARPFERWHSTEACYESNRNRAVEMLSSELDLAAKPADETVLLGRESSQLENGLRVFEFRIGTNDTLFKQSETQKELWEAKLKRK